MSNILIFWCFTLELTDKLTSSNISYLPQGSQSLLWSFEASNQELLTNDGWRLYHILVWPYSYWRGHHHNWNVLFKQIKIGNTHADWKRIAFVSSWFSLDFKVRICSWRETSFPSSSVIKPRSSAANVALHCSCWCLAVSSFLASPPWVLWTCSNSCFFSTRRFLS